MSADDLRTRLKEERAQRKLASILDGVQDQQGLIKRSATITSPRRREALVRMARELAAPAFVPKAPNGGIKADPADGDGALRYQFGAGPAEDLLSWFNGSIKEVGAEAVVMVPKYLAGANVAEIVDLGNNTWRIDVVGAASLTNGTYNGQLLYWNGTAWVPTAQPTAEGDLLYWDGTNHVWLGIGDTDEVLTVAGGIPAWAPAMGGGIPTGYAELVLNVCIGGVSTAKTFLVKV